MQEEPTSPVRKTRAPRGAGRPKHFDIAALRDVWVYVQSWAIITKWPISRICDAKNASFSWYAAGIPDCDRGLRLEHQVDHETLRRRYYEAVRFLKAESESYRKLRSMKFTSLALREVSATERWWRQLRDENVARIKNTAA
jgi:hypothetical protein